MEPRPHSGEFETALIREPNRTTKSTGQKVIEKLQRNGWPTKLELAYPLHEWRSSRGVAVSAGTATGSNLSVVFGSRNDFSLESGLDGIFADHRTAPGTRSIAAA